VPHVGSCGLRGEKPLTEASASLSVPEPRTVVRLPRMAAGLGEQGLAELILEGGLPSLDRLREQHPLCRIDLELFAQDGRRVRPAFIVRPATGAAGPVATSIAMGKAVRDVESLVEALRPLLAQGLPQPGGWPPGDVPRVLPAGDVPRVLPAGTLELGLRGRVGEEDSAACAHTFDAPWVRDTADGVW